MLKPLCLLTAKPAMYVGNVDEDGFETTPCSNSCAPWRKAAAPVVPICAKIEAEIADLSDEDRLMFLAEMGQDEPGLNQLIHAAYNLLGLQTYFTAGVKEVRAWTIHRATPRPRPRA